MERNEEVGIHCANGLGAHLIELDQHSTYQGLLDGGPTHEINEMLLGNIASDGGGVPTHLVRPTETLIEPERQSPYGRLMMLPRLQCRGLFESGTHWLWIVWFQKTWAPPMDPAVVDELRTLDFLSNAKDEMSSW